QPTPKMAVNSAEGSQVPPPPPPNGPFSQAATAVSAPHPSTPPADTDDDDDEPDERQDFESGWGGLGIGRLLFAASVLALIVSVGLWILEAQFKKQEQAARLDPQNAVGPDRPASHERAPLVGSEGRSLTASPSEQALALPVPAKPESRNAAVFKPGSEMRPAEAPAKHPLATVETAPPVRDAVVTAICGLEGRPSEVQSMMEGTDHMLKSADQALQRLLAAGFLRQPCPIGDLHQKGEQLGVKEAEEKRDTARDRAETRVEASSSAGEKQGNEAKPETKSESQRERLEATAQKQQKLVIKDCETCPELIVAPAGSFLMGSAPYEEGRSHGEGPQRRITIGHSFAVGRFAITVDEFKEFVNDTGFHTGDLCAAGEEYVARSSGSFESPPGFAAGFVQGGSHPVVCVNWVDAKAFLAWLSNKTKRNYRLLTEA